jgi:hypothetical protein
MLLEPAQLGAPEWLGTDAECAWVLLGFVVTLPAPDASQLPLDA